MRGIDFREARSGVRIAEVLLLMGCEPGRLRGPQLRGPCPLHRSHRQTSRVFAVHLDKNIYYCFRCGAQGNALDLWAAWTAQGLHAAVLDLYQRLGREVPWLPCSARRSAAKRPCPGLSRRESPSMHDP